MSERAGTGSGLRVAVGLPARPGVTPGRVLRAEAGKVAALPAVRWAVLVAVVVNAVVACVVVYDARYRPDATPPDLPGLLTGALVATQLPVLVLGVLVSAAEYPSGAARTTFLAVPRRTPVLAAQALVAAVLAALTAAGALLVTALAVQPFRGGIPLPLDLTEPPAARVLGGFVLYLLLVALLGVALGSLGRGPVAGLVAGAVLLVLLERLLPLAGVPQLVTVLPGWAGRLVVAPDAAAAAQAAGVSLTPWLGMGVLAAWALVLLLAAAVRLGRSGV